MMPMMPTVIPSFDVVDSFTYSTTLRLLQTQYRANVLAQLEVLRRARGYKARYYTSPDSLVEPILAFGQVETQIRAVPGTYVWGLSLYAATITNLKIQVTDASTEIPLFSDYIRAALMQPSSTGGRVPFLLGQPRLISEPGQINVEIYNDNATTNTVQLVLYCAEPVLPNPDINEANHYQRYRRLS
jgi:hypothetical protein